MWESSQYALLLQCMSAWLTVTVFFSIILLLSVLKRKYSSLLHLFLIAVPELVKNNNNAFTSRKR